MELLLLVLSFASVLSTEASWTQQYGDDRSSSYVPSKEVIDQGWKYLGPRASFDLAHVHSPCVTEDATIFFGLQSRLLAVSSKGYVLREYDVQQSGAEYYLQTSNALYSQSFGTVVVIVSGDTSDHEEGQLLVRISALDPSSDKVLWYNDENDYEAMNWLAMSEKYGLVYVIKGYGHNSNLVGLSLKDGSTVWSVPLSITSSMWPNFMKVSEELSLLLLPTVPGVNDGILYAINAATGDQLWQQTLGFNEESSFAISSTAGVIYGCMGLFPDIAHGKQIMILDAKKGTVLYSGAGYCTNASRAMTPSVDSSGNGYYSCGNQVFSVTPSGKLRWQSAVYGYQSLPPYLPVSIHPDGTVFYVTINQTTILALSSQDGSLIQSYAGRPDVAIIQPPILVGDKYMYIVGAAQHSTPFIYPMKR